MKDKALVYTNTKYGPMIAPFKDPWIGSSLVAMGEYSPVEVDFLTLLSDPNKLTIDVGANIGAISIPLSRHAWDTLAFEACPFTYDLLKCNVELTNANVTPINFAATDSPKHFSTDGTEDDSTKDLGSLKIIEDPEGDIKGVTIDSYVDTMGVPVGLIKVDVEGHEPEVLRGAFNTIEKDRPYVFFEAISKEPSATGVKIMQDHGYEMRWFISFLYHYPNFKKYNRNPWANTASFNIIAWPEDKHLPIFDQLTKIEDVEVGGGKAGLDQIIVGLGGEEDAS